VPEPQPVLAGEAAKNLSSTSSLPPAEVFGIAEGQVSCMNESNRGGNG